MPKKTNTKRVVFASLSVKTLVSVITIMAVVTVLMLAVYFSVIRQNAAREYQQLIQTSVSNIDRVFAMHIQNADFYCQSYYSSVDGTKTRLNSLNNRKHIAKFSAEIRESFKIMPFTQSVGIIDKGNALTHLVQNDGNNGNRYVADIESLLLEELAGVKGVKTPLLWTAPNRYTNKEEISLLTRFFREFHPTSEQFNGTVVLNIDTQHFSQILFSDAEQNGVTFFVLDDKGIIAAHSDISYCGEDWSEKAYVKNIILNEAHLQEEKINGIRYELYSVPSAVEGYYIVAQSKYLNALEKEKSWMIPMMCGVALMMGLAVILLWIVLNRLFRPFNQMMARVKTASFMESENKKQDDVTVLHNYHTILSANIDALQQSEVKNRIVKALLCKRNVESLLLHNGYIYQNIPYYLVLVHLGEEKNIVRQLSDYDSYRAYLEELFEARFKGVGQCTCFEIGFRRMLILVSGQPEKPVIYNAMCNALSRLQIKIQADCPMDTALWVSNEVDWKVSERNISSVFDAGEECLKTYRFMNPEERIAQIAEEMQGENWRPLLDTVLYYTKKRDSIHFQSTVKDLLERMQTQPWGQFHQMVLVLAIEITKIWNPEKLSEKYYKTLEEKITEFDDKKELYIWLTELFDDATAWIQNVESYSTVQLMEKMVQYIQDNYADNDMNLNTLAAHLHISAPYLGKLFREFTGNGFNEYLLQIRMERAKTLLLLKRDTSITVIAEQVGYRNNSYFTASFKKYFGVSPSKFRNYQDQEETE